MTIELIIPEEDAACIWSNHHGERQPVDLNELLERILHAEAEQFRTAFPKCDMKDLVAKFHLRP